MRRSWWLSAAAVLGAATWLGLPLSARAELAAIKVAKQYGISYLPLMLMEDGKLIEKHAQAAGIEVKVTWRRLPAAT